MLSRTILRPSAGSSRRTVSECSLLGEPWSLFSIIFRRPGLIRVSRLCRDTGYRYAGAPKAEMQQAICPAFQGSSVSRYSAYITADEFLVTDIADRYGPVDLACLPISTGSSLSFLRSLLHISLNHYALTSTQHLNSWDAMQISRMMGAKATLAIHHSTFSPEDESRGNIVGPNTYNT